MLQGPEPTVGIGLVRGMVWLKGAEEELGADSAEHEQVGRYRQEVWRPRGENGRWRPS